MGKRVVSISRQRRNARRAINAARAGGHVVKLVVRGRWIDDFAAREFAADLGDTLQELLSGPVPRGAISGAELILRRHGESENLLADRHLRIRNEEEDGDHER